MVIYTRVSTNKKEQKTSLDIQREYYTDFAKKKLHTLQHIYADEGLSGTNVRREQFKQMLYDAGLDYVRNDRGSDQFNLSDRPPKFELIVVKDVSRFARNTVVGFDTIKNLRTKGVEIYFENNGLSSFDDLADSVLPFLLGMAESESKGISKKVSFTKQHQARTGVYKPAVLPYGFRRTDDKKIVIEEHEAELVRVMFNRFLEVGAKTIAQEFNREGLRDRNNRSFSAIRINRIIRNTLYYGDVTTNKRSRKNVTDTSLTKNSPDEYIVIKNAVEPIVTKELWQECNLKADERTNPITNKGLKPSYNDHFAQLLFCSNCGKQYTRHTNSGQTKITYICITRRLKGTCNNKSISYNQLKKSMAEIKIDHGLDYLNSRLDYTELKRSIVEIKRSMTEKKEVIHSEIAELERTNKAATNMMIQLFSTSKDAEVVEQVKSTIEERNQQIKKLQYQDAQLNLDYIMDFENELDEKLELISSFLERKTNTFEEMLPLIEKVIIEDHILHFHLTGANFKDEIKKLKERYGVEITGVSHLNNVYTVPRQLKVSIDYFNNVYRIQQDKDAEEYFMSEEFLTNREIGGQSDN